MQKIAIIGRPNVGKSTLFNRLVGKRRAMVHDTPGVTRDRREEPAQLAGLKFILIDTAGLEEAAPETLQGKMLKQTTTAADEAEILILITDGTVGLRDEDRFFAKWARKKDKPIILVVNKCERKDASIEDFYKLGFGEPIAISAEHNLGMDELFQALQKNLKKEEAPKEDDDKVIQITIAGRPNVGKSTILNKLMNEERVIVSPIAGTTRDSISANWEYKGHKMKLVDTAGLRKKSTVTEDLEYFSVGDTLNSVKFAHVVILVMDATQAFEKQDMKIANHAITEGRAVVVVLNKWDLVKDKKDAMEEIKFQLARNFNTVPNVPFLTLSAENDQSVDVILDKALKTYEIWNTRISTGQLNNWLEELLNTNPPPIAKGRRIKIRFITQTKTRPPTFMLSVSQPDNMPDSYLKYFTNFLREAFNMPGVPIRILMPQKDNPYHDKE